MHVRTHTHTPHAHNTTQHHTLSLSLFDTKEEEKAHDWWMQTHLQWTVIGPSCPNCSLVLCTWPMKSMKPSPDLGTPCSGQSVNWNCRMVRDCPSWMQNNKAMKSFINTEAKQSCHKIIYQHWGQTIMQWNHLSTLRPNNNATKSFINTEAKQSCHKIIYQHWGQTIMQWNHLSTLRPNNNAMKSFINTEAKQ